MTPRRWIPKRTARRGHKSGFAKLVGIELHICCSVQLSFKLGAVQHCPSQSSSAIITPRRWIPKRTASHYDSDTAVLVAMLCILG
ncbi:hypothetical protein HBI29_008010 [Parastagonospora nodorum]|nr:hypothetical protein HBI29_008010 [Parastagonospora nodorum]